METRIETSQAIRDAIKAYGEFSFDTDVDYQQGLASILSNGSIDPSVSEEIREEMIRRTRVFYFNTITGNSITMEEAKEYERQTTGKSEETNDENRVLTFAELKELIETGNVDKIPNNKVIPEGLNDAPPSESTVPARRKPWEEAST